MNDDLRSDWLPDRSRFDASTRWILSDAPLAIRILPFLGIAFTIGLVVACVRLQLPIVSSPFPVELHVEPEGVLRIVPRTDTAELPSPRLLGAVVLQETRSAGSRRTRSPASLTGHVERIERSPSGGYFLWIRTGKNRSEIDTTFRWSARIETGRRSLFAEIASRALREGSPR